MQQKQILAAFSKRNLLQGHWVAQKTYKKDAEADLENRQWQGRLESAQNPE